MFCKRSFPQRLQWWDIPPFIYFFQPNYESAAKKSPGAAVSRTVLSPGLSCLQDCPVSRSALSPGLSCLQDCPVSCHLYSLEEKPGVGDCSLLDSHCQGQQCVLWVCSMAKGLFRHWPRTRVSFALPKRSTLYARAEKQTQRGLRPSCFNDGNLIKEDSVSIINY